MYRLIVFYLQKWNDKMEIPSFCANGVVGLTCLLNIALILILPKVLFDFNPLIHATLVSNPFFIVILVTIVVLVVNEVVIFSKRNSILKEFRNVM